MYYTVPLFALLLKITQKAWKEKNTPLDEVSSSRTKNIQPSVGLYFVRKGPSSRTNY